MRKIIILTILLSVIALAAFFVFKANRERIERKEAYAQIPAFSLLSIDNEIITEQSLRKNTPVLFVFFDPGGCGPCDVVMRGINARKDEFSAFQLVFFSLDPIEFIIAHLQKLDFSPAENMFFLFDENLNLFTAMDVRTSPTVFIYNSKGVLTNRFNGFVSTETILNYLQPPKSPSGAGLLSSNN